MKIKDPALLAIGLVITLAPLTTIKFHDVQLSELSVLLALVLAWVKSKFEKSPTACPNDGLQIYQSAMQFFLVALLLTSLLDTWMLSVPAQEGQGPFKRPYWLAAARVTQLFLATHFALLLRKNGQEIPGFSTWAAKLYTRVGFWVCIFSIINFWLCRYGLEIPLPGKPSYINMPRAQGTFVEPGPFGLYVVSLLMLEGIRVRMGERMDALKWLLFFLCLLLSVSKAGFMALTLMAPLILLYKKPTRLLKVLWLALLILVPLTGLKIVEDYSQIISNIDYSSHPLLDGRMMAFYALPRMFALSPWLGIGFGNYPLMRNSPEILNGMPPSPIWDLHGSGLMGVAVEMGLPLFLGFMALLIWPIRNAVTLQRDPWIKMALWFPVIAFFVGAQIHFLYPWIYLATATGLASSKKTKNEINKHAGKLSAKAAVRHPQ